jgi:RNA polymerase sigma factor (sigma-70 family)
MAPRMRVTSASVHIGEKPRNNRTRNFELFVLPHGEAVRNLAAWLTGNITDAEDVVQEVYLRAFRYFDSYQGGNYRLWLLAVVRNTFISWARMNRTSRLEFYRDPFAGNTARIKETVWDGAPCNPEILTMRRADDDLLKRLIQQIPAEYREALLLREFEHMAYKEIADVTGVPIGTVMSRLSRARLALRRLWLREAQVATPMFATARGGGASRVRPEGYCEPANVGASRRIP